MLSEEKISRDDASVDMDFPATTAVCVADSCERRENRR